MRRFVNHKAIDSVEQFLISGGLQSGRRPRPWRRCGRQRFRRCDVLAVDVGDGCGFAVIRVVSVLWLIHARSLRPHRAHRHFVHLLHFHTVGNKSAPDFVGFSIVGHAALMKSLFQLAVVLSGNQVCDGLAEVPKKMVARCGTFHDSAGQAQAATESDRTRAAS